MNQENTDSMKHASYTSSRPDIFCKVPEDAVKILDVGCSNGTLGNALRSVNPGRIVEGIEFDESYCREASSKLDRVIHADLNQMNWAEHFQPESFDCLIFADSLEHLIDPWRVLSEAIKYLQPGGKVIISVPNIRHISSLNSIFFKGVFPRIDRGIFDSTHLRWFTAKDAINLVKGSGLEFLSISASLRINDIPGTRMNRFASRYLSRLSRFRLVQEFLGYQFVVEGIKAEQV